MTFARRAHLSNVNVIVNWIIDQNIASSSIGTYHFVYFIEASDGQR